MFIVTSRDNKYRQKKGDDDFARIIKEGFPFSFAIKKKYINKLYLKNLLLQSIKND